MSKVLIIGGGSIGIAVADKLSGDYGSKIVIADCRIPDEKDKNPDYEYIRIDIAKDDLSPLKMPDVDTLIITAGIGRLDFFENFSEEEIAKDFAVNTMPAVKLIRAYYDKINGSEPFYTAVVTSICGLVASPLYSVYSATKAALVKLIEGINAELAFNGRPNRILDICPGNIPGTGFHNQAPTAQQREMHDALAGDIVNNMYNRQQRFIPNEQVYSGVISRYNADGIKFADESIKYKLENNSIISKPQIKVGYLTGTFDLFHIGHLNLLRNAKKYCDKLVVGVHPDGKHKNKEIFIPLDERVEIVKNIKYVDDVIVCTSEDIDAYEQVKFDYLFVGSDYQGTERFKRYEKFFEGTDTKIIYLPYTTKTSSTQLRAALSK